jgi:hypothetical protein
MQIQQLGTTSVFAREKAVLDEDGFAVLEKDGTPRVTPSRWEIRRNPKDYNEVASVTEMKVTGAPKWLFLRDTTGSLSNDSGGKKVSKPVLQGGLKPSAIRTVEPP